MSKPDLKLGRELAEKASKGPWVGIGNGKKEGSYFACTPIHSEDCSMGNYDKAFNDTKFIEHHSGQTMIQIYDYISELEDKCRVADEVYAEFRLRGDAIIVMQNKISSLEAQNKILTESRDEYKIEVDEVEFVGKEWKKLAESLSAQNKEMHEALSKIKACTELVDPIDDDSLEVPTPEASIAKVSLSRVEEMRKK